MPIIALVTDLGTDNWFAGELKGTILSLNPRAVPVDITHSIPRGGVRDGAFALLASYRSFPEDTVFLSAVDYGDAQARVIAAKTASHSFIAPDNGLLSWMLRREPSAEIREVNIREYLLPSGCATFPARDLLAPLAADLADWLEFARSGKTIKNHVKLNWPETRVDNDGKITAEIIYADSFGNAITSITPRELSERCKKEAVCTIIKSNVDVSSKNEIPVRTHYNDVPKDNPVAYPGSAGLIEIAINGGSAVDILGINIGDGVCFWGE